uniref:Uncharacterized protein n=1 Tax=Callorhinchus milii TaxID=7868 RepID=A0A4W3GYC3_CALMI
MNSLEFCNAVIQVAHPLVRNQLVDYLHNGFLVPVMGPALHKVSHYLSSSLPPSSRFFPPSHSLPFTPSLSLPLVHSLPFGPSLPSLLPHLTRYFPRSLPHLLPSLRSFPLLVPSLTSFPSLPSFPPSLLFVRSLPFVHSLAPSYHSSLAPSPPSLPPWHPPSL